MNLFRAIQNGHAIFDDGSTLLLPDWCREEYRTYFTGPAWALHWADPDLWSASPQDTWAYEFMVGGASRSSFEECLAELVACRLEHYGAA